MAKGEKKLNQKQNNYGKKGTEKLNFFKQIKLYSERGSFL